MLFRSLRRWKAARTAGVIRSVSRCRRSVASCCAVPEAQVLTPVAMAPGVAFPLGATPMASGINFAVHAAPETRVQLVLCHPDGSVRTTVELQHRTGTVWHGLVEAPFARVGDLYGYRVFADADPAQGQRVNRTKFLLDPAARAITGEPRVDDALYDGPESSDLDSMQCMPRCRIVGREFEIGRAHV